MTFVVRALDHRSFGRLEWCNVRMDDLVAWLRGLFHDFSVRAPFGLGWELDRAQPPLTATVTPADGWTALFRLTGDDVGERLNFADQLRVFLDTELDRPVPPCPNHLAGLVPVRVDDTVEWRCPEGDFRCRVGDYEEALWPPGLQEDPGNVAPMLAARFRRLDVRGIQSVAVELRGRRWVAVVELRPDGDETAVREAAAPVVVEAEPVDAMRTVRLERPATERSRLTEPLPSPVLRCDWPCAVADLAEPSSLATMTSSSTTSLSDCSPSIGSGRPAVRSYWTLQANHSRTRGIASAASAGLA
jgi:hypothetical protein